jgi:glycosyltransferase involved in cell wall biosynthesis
MTDFSRKLRVLYTIPMFSQECVGTYARFHDVIHTLQRMYEPPWEHTIVPLRRYYGEPSPRVLFQDGNAFFRLRNYLRNIARASREADIVHIIQGDLINSLPPLILVPLDKPLVAGPNLTTFFYPPHVAPLLMPPVLSPKGLSYRLKLSRHWRNRLVFAHWSPLSRRFRLLLAFSDYHKELYAESGVDIAQIEVLPTGVRTDLFNPSDTCYSLPSSRFLSVLYVGDLKKPLLKGFDVFVEGLRYLEEEEIPFHAWIVGGTGDQIKYRLPFSQDRLSFLGYVPRQELGRHYCSCDVFVNSSRFEVDGTTSVEALACGTPVIGTDIPSFAAKNHLTFQWASGPDLGRKLKEFYERPARFKQKALANAANWDIRAAIEKLLSIYESLA